MASRNPASLVDYIMLTKRTTAVFLQSFVLRAMTACYSIISCTDQRWNRVRIFDPVTRPDPIRSLSVVKQIIDNGLIAVSVRPTCQDTQTV